MPQSQLPPEGDEAEFPPPEFIDDNDGSDSSEEDEPQFKVHIVFFVLFWILPAILK